MQISVSRISKWLPAIALVTAAFWAASAPVLAQCAMCYATAASQSDKGIQALNLGIIVLLIPPVTIMSGILLYAFRCRNAQESWNRRELKSRDWALEAGERNGVALPPHFFERPVSPLS